MPRVLNIPNIPGRVLSMQKLLLSILNMPEHALTEFLGCKCAGILNMAGL